MDLARSASPPSRTRLTALRQRVPAVLAHVREPRFRVLATLATLFAIALAAFAHTVEDYLTGDPLVRWDVEFSRWLHEHSSSTVVSLFKAVTLLGNVAFLALLTLAVAVYLLRRRRLDDAALLGVAAVGIEVVNALLKLVFQRPRPELAYLQLDTYSFPSGHATGSAAIYGIMLYLLARRSSPRRRIACALGYVVLVGAIGFSRLYLEVHYLSDVLAGVSLGAAWAAAWLLIYEARHDAVSRLLPPRLRRLAARVAPS